MYVCTNMNRIILYNLRHSQNEAGHVQKKSSHKLAHAPAPPHAHLHTQSHTHSHTHTRTHTHSVTHRHTQTHTDTHSHAHAYTHRHAHASLSLSLTRARSLALARSPLLVRARVFFLSDNLKKEGEREGERWVLRAHAPVDKCVHLILRVDSIV